MSRIYGERGAQACRRSPAISMSAADGELVAVVGPSGCGKSTLLELICGLQTPDGGSIACAPAVLMPQHDLLLPWLSAVDNAALALRIARLPREEARRRAAALFEELGLEGFQEARPSELSGGMRQRVAFLRTLLSGKPVLCLDEPFGALDAITRGEMQAWLSGALAREPRTVVLVTHDVEEAILLADRVLVLSPRPGRVIEEVEVAAAAPAVTHRRRCYRPARARAQPALTRSPALARTSVSAQAPGGERILGRAIRAALPPLLLVAALLGLWEIYVDSGADSSFVLPAPHSIAAAMWNNAGLLAANLRPTAEEVGLGILLALLLGFVLAVLIHLSPALRRAVYPLAVGSQAVPIAVIAPLLVFWWGFGMFPKLVVIVVICFFPVLVTTVDGLAAVDPDQLKLMRTLDASRWQAFRFAELPTALPAALSGARIALAVGVIGAYIAESQTATSGIHAGLGHEINADLTALQTPRAYAAAVVLFVFAIACFHAIGLAERRLAPWSVRSRGDTT